MGKHPCDFCSSPGLQTLRPSCAPAFCDPLGSVMACARTLGTYYSTSMNRAHCTTLSVVPPETVSQAPPLPHLGPGPGASARWAPISGTPSAGLPQSAGSRVLPAVPTGPRQALTVLCCCPFRHWLRLFSFQVKTLKKKKVASHQRHQLRREHGPFCETSPVLQVRSVALLGWLAAPARRSGPSPRLASWRPGRSRRQVSGSLAAGGRRQLSWLRLHVDHQDTRRHHFITKLRPAASVHRASAFPWHVL